MGLETRWILQSGKGLKHRWVGLSQRRRKRRRIDGSAPPLSLSLEGLVTCNPKAAEAQAKAAAEKAKVEEKARVEAQAKAAAEEKAKAAAAEKAAAASKADVNPNPETREPPTFWFSGFRFRVSGFGFQVSDPGSRV